MQYNAVLTLLEVTRYKQFLCDTNSNFQRNQLANLFYKPENWSKMNLPPPALKVSACLLEQDTELLHSSEFSGPHK